MDGDRQPGVRVRLIEDTIDLSAYLETAPAERIVPASTFWEQVRDDFLMPTEARGARTPWPKVDPLIRFRPGEVSLWPGTNYSGKSTVTSQVALGFCQQDEKVCIASFEMPPRKTMKRMVRQASNGPEPSLRFQKQFADFTDGRLWIFDHMGSIAWPRVVAVARYCSDKLGITQFFIDSLMKCVRGEDDYNGQKDFVNDLCAVALETNMHIHLVHHTKKPSDESQKPSRYDAKGSGSISDQVDNVFNVWRNKVKERLIEEGDTSEETKSQPDTLLICDKQRNGEWDGKVALWFDRGSMNYRGDPRAWSQGMTFERQPGEDFE